MVKWLSSAPLALALGSSACGGLSSGIDYPGDSGDYDKFLVTPENEPGGSTSLGNFKIGPDACKGIDTHPMVQPLNQENLTRFLEAQGVKIEPRKARTNLYWYDFPNGEGGFVRLRLAILDSPAGAARDLHASLLEHGPGWWGVRRSNLAVLAPKASLGDAVGFAIKNKLVCWGMLTYAGLDDAYVVTGPYAEL